MKETVSPIFKIAVRAAAALVAVATLGYVTSKALVLDGRLSVTTDFATPAPFVSEPKPSGRLAPPEKDGSGKVSSQFVADPLYIDLTPPGRFDTIAMSVRYENAGQPVIELGALGSAIDEQYAHRPAENRLLDALSWSRVSSGELTLLQRNRRYASIDEFLREPPDRTTVATYHAKASFPYVLPDYAPSGVMHEREVSLRGHHRLYAYVKDEPLALTLQLQDMNRQLGADPVVLSVYRDGDDEPVTRTVLEDDGNTQDDQKSSKLRAISVSVPAPASGLYEIEFTANPDVFIRRIATRQRKLVFAGKLYLGDHVGYSDRTDPITVNALGQLLIMRTPHAESGQSVSVGGAKTTLDQPNLRYKVDLGERAGFVPVVVPKRDVLLETDGVFALDRESAFDPFPMSIEWHTTAADLDSRGIDYVLTSYEPPADDDGLKSVEARFDERELAKTKEGAFRFVITAPGIGDLHNDVRIASVTFDMRRTPFSLAAAWKKLFGGEETVAPGVRIMNDGKSYGESLP
jgi:hypothetical protein